MQVSERMDMERQISIKAAECLLAAGFSVAVFDGEEVAQSPTRDMEAIKAALFSTDEDHLFAHNPDGSRFGWVRLIYGNDGWDVIADNTANLEEHLAGATELADQLEERYHTNSGH